MTSKKQASIERRVHDAAQAALSSRKVVSPIDILVGAGFVTEKQLNDWRFGRIPYLERVACGNLRTRARAVSVFRKWTSHNGLKPSWTAYHGWGGARKITLRFSKSGLPNIERAYATHYISPALRRQPTPPKVDLESEGASFADVPNA